MYSAMTKISYFRGSVQQYVHRGEYHGGLIAHNHPGTHCIFNAGFRRKASVRLILACLAVPGGTP